MSSSQTLAGRACFKRLCSPESDPAVRRDTLRQAAQLALQVEFTTLPVYLTGLYSITDTASDAYQALRSVAMEEMFHVNQAANLVVALGGLPSFTGEAVPKYPCHLPQANPKSTPMVGLYRASLEVFDQVYAAIETPSLQSAPPQGAQYDSIAQLYEFFVAALKAYDAAHGNPFVPEMEQGRQRTDIYLGKYGGKVNRIRNLESALRAVDQIVQQGEGTVPDHKPLAPTERFGSYNHYGERTDCTYGPILGKPWEMSHFIKFRRVATSAQAFPPTLPIISNPSAQQFEGENIHPDAQLLKEAFDIAYSVMLRGFERSFQRGGDPYFNVVLNLMHHVMPHLARLLMRTPLYRDGDSDVGPNAAPVWAYNPAARLPDLRRLLREYQDRQLQAGRGDNPLMQSLRAALKGLKNLPEAPVAPVAAPSSAAATVQSGDLLNIDAL